MKKKIVAIIPARGGSKEIPKKNITILGGKPLIAWPIKLGQSIKRIDRVIVSTDDVEIMSLAKKYKAEAPFKRPNNLAKNDTPTLPVLQHAINYLENKDKYKPDIVLLLYPTTPFMRRERIEEALDLFEETGCNSVTGVIQDSGRFWKYDKGRYVPFYPKNRVNRQYFKPLYREAGNIYFSRYNVIMKMNKLVDENNIQFIKVDENETLDIDTPVDLIKARHWLKKKHRSVEK